MVGCIGWLEVMVGNLVVVGLGVFVLIILVFVSLIYVSFDVDEKIVVCVFKGLVGVGSSVC